MGAARVKRRTATSQFHGEKQNGRDIFDTAESSGKFAVRWGSGKKRKRVGGKIKGAARLSSKAESAHWITEARTDADACMTKS